VTKVKRIDVEVLPPQERSTTAAEPFARLIAYLMDNAFRIPGTNIRFGLDPIIGLLPGMGDTLGGLVSALVLVQSVQLGLPRVVIARMALNVIINSVVGALPIVGDAFSFWFKSNARNHALLLKHAHSRTSTRGDWVFVSVVIAIVLLVLASVFFLLATLLSKLFGS
jgi:Domain of unknown function (DUF4112)